ncbi:MAG: hypothetical protein IJI98_06330 [Methanosphaera sp.]|nr:hypothetical protein [Methanosphaera sp.]
MNLGEYNGFSSEERYEGDKIIKKAIKEGLLPDLHTIPCELCGQTKGIREYHTEDYSPDTILDNVICVCKHCHMHIHQKNKGKGWYDYEEMLKRGEKTKPWYDKRYWTEEDDLEI